MFDIKSYKSHPNKLLVDHLSGVIENTKRLTNSKLMELVAIFHDIGKINQNFQSKLRGLSLNEYSKHSYISAYAFFCAAVSSPANRTKICKFLGWNTLSSNDIIGITILIAKHHGNIPDFCPKGIIASILSKQEKKEMIQFVSNNYMPLYKFVKHFIELDDFTECVNNENVKQYFIKYFVFSCKEKDNPFPLDFFLDLQFTFAVLIQSDKSDAAYFGNFIESRKIQISEFSKVFNHKLDTHLSKLNQDSELNKLRTEIRCNSIRKINIGLSIDRRVFELTSPTGSGKTLMLLSLASEILKTKGAKRIVYSLPFLSITEQVESEVLKILKGHEDYVQRIDSKSENYRFEKIQDSLESKSDEGLLKELNLLEFQENTFSFPFVITTFVRFFETLLSNRNSELLKLPNFSNCIFLLDEIQALPPRLYGFFVAYLTRFCEKFDSYAVISTATQPNFELPKYDDYIKQFFNHYEQPFQLLPIDYFENNLFNRYIISYRKEGIEIYNLKERILEENNSVLVILNTINDTLELYNLLLDDLSPDELILLNTHFTPSDRKKKIEIAKKYLNEEQKVVVVSTQLIEAGVDIDFPILYRDFATVSSIIQSAGRCNRNGKFPKKGKVVLFNLVKDGKKRSEFIYRGKDKDLLNFTKRALVNDEYKEFELLSVQKLFFDRIQKELLFGKHWCEGNNDLINPDFDFLKDIRECMFEKIGKFQLIDNNIFGEEFSYYIADGMEDNNFEILLFKQKELIDSLRINSDFRIVKNKKKEIEIHLKKMANRIVQVKLKQNQAKPLLASERSYFNLYKIDGISYSFQKGLDLKGEECIL